MKVLKRLRTLMSSSTRSINQPGRSEREMLLLGRLLSESLGDKKQLDSLGEVEFSVFSQFGDDGIIQWLVKNLEFPHKTFIEFGVADYRESNTRFLMMNNNWSGLVMDGSQENINHIRSSEYFWKHELLTKAVFIDRSNISDLLMSAPFDKEIGILHIDLDGNDYWIWKEIECITPRVVILEYNSVLGFEDAITVPYDEKFERTEAHFTNLYYGASLPAMYRLSQEKGYSFIGCNTAGNNAYFVRADLLNDVVREVSIESGSVASKLRESRDRVGGLSCLAGTERKKAIQGMPVYNVDHDEIEEF